MLRTEPTDFPLLLEVFREGLVMGLIPKDDVVAWADKIINIEVEPAYFFIEISLSKDINQLVEVLDRYTTWRENPIPPRVLMGLIYKKLIDESNPITGEDASILTSRINNLDILTRFEYHSICTFEDYEMYYLPDATQLWVEILNFLSIYKDFNLLNHGQWAAINSRVEEVLKEEQEKLDVVNEAYKKAATKRENRRKLKRHALLSIPVVIVLGIILVNIKMTQGGPTWSKSLFDHEYLFYLDFFGAYLMLRLGYAFWLKKRRRR